MYSAEIRADATVVLDVRPSITSPWLLKLREIVIKQWYLSLTITPVVDHAVLPCLCLLCNIYTSITITSRYNYILSKAQDSILTSASQHLDRWCVHWVPSVLHPAGRYCLPLYPGTGACCQLTNSIQRSSSVYWYACVEGKEDRRAKQSCTIDVIFLKSWNWRWTFCPHQISTI